MKDKYVTLPRLSTTLGAPLARTGPLPAGCGSLPGATRRHSGQRTASCTHLRMSPGTGSTPPENSRFENVFTFLHRMSSPWV